MKTYAGIPDTTLDAISIILRYDTAASGLDYSSICEAARKYWKERHKCKPLPVSVKIIREFYEVEDTSWEGYKGKVDVDSWVYNVVNDAIDDQLPSAYVMENPKDAERWLKAGLLATFEPDVFKKLRGITGEEEGEE